MRHFHYSVGLTEWSQVIPRACGLFVCLGILFVSADRVHAQGWMHEARPPSPPPTPGLWGKTALGGQLGPWFSGNLGKDFVQSDVRLTAGGTAFHLEFFYQPHLTGVLNLDFNFGAVTRGDLRATVAGSSTLGNATLYPLGAGVIVFPLAKQTNLRFQPLLRAGGSLVIGTEQLELLTQEYYGVGTVAHSRTAWGYYAGAGASWLLGTSVALTGSVKYQFAKFKEELFGVRDYSGVQVLIGAAYLYR